MAENKEKLFDMFPPISTEEWLAKINVDLKGADYQKKLVWRTNEGFDVQPLYRAEDLEKLTHLNTLPGEFPYVRGTRTNNDWRIRQDVNGETAQEINDHARHIIDRGVDSIGICVCNKLDKESLATALAGIDLKKIEVNFKCCPSHILEAGKIIAGYIKEQELQNDFRGSLAYDPFKRLFKHGMAYPKDIAAEAKELMELFAEIPYMRLFAVDTFMLNNAGAYITQELGCALAWGAQWLTMLTEAGLKACDVAKRIKFNMGISSNYSWR